MKQNLYDMIPAIGEQTGYVDSIIDEQFPHIAEKIWIMWGSEECMNYIENLVNYSPTADRPERQGFPFQALIELNIILDEHQKQFPNIKTELTHRVNTPWS